LTVNFSFADRKRANDHPLRDVVQALRLHQHCQELSLSALSAAEGETYLTARFMNDSLATTLGPVLHRRTEGNPLFMINLLEHWIAHDWLSHQQGQWILRTGWETIAGEIPATLRELVTQRQARLSPTEQRLLEVASVAGLEFSAASVAAGLTADVVETETRCEELTRRGEFLQACGVDTWPDGTVATRYRFRHTLYQDVVYERIPAARQAQLHQRIGEREEAGYGEKCGEIAARLAMHFGRGHDFPREIQHRHQAAQQAMQRSGYQEAIVHLSRGLELLQQSPESPERVQLELSMQVALGSSLKVSKGYGDPDAEHAYLRAWELYRQLGDPPQLSPVLYSLYELYEYRGAFHRSRELGEQLLHLAHRWQDPTLLLGAYDARACTAFHLGAFAQVIEYTERGLSLYDLQQHGALASLYGKDLGASCGYWAAMALWFLGYPDQALERINEALTLAQELAHPYTVAVVHNRAAFLGQFLRQSHVARQWAEAGTVMAAEHGFPRHVALGAILTGWALAMQGHGEEGIAQIRQGMVAYREVGMVMEDPYFLALLADAHAGLGQIAEGLAAVAAALTTLGSGRGFFCEAELHRQQGELLLRQVVPDEQQAEACFNRALAVARRQQAKSPELRGAMSLSRLWQRQGKRQAARQLLAEVYGWFTEGFETADLREAQALLEELS
jgi:predicted ATPase